MMMMVKWPAQASQEELMGFDSVEAKDSKRQKENVVDQVYISVLRGGLWWCSVYDGGTGASGTIHALLELPM